MPAVALDSHETVGRYFDGSCNQHEGKLEERFVAQFFRIVYMAWGDLVNVPVV